MARGEVGPEGDEGAAKLLEKVVNQARMLATLPWHQREPPGEPAAFSPLGLANLARRITVSTMTCPAATGAAAAAVAEIVVATTSAPCVANLDSKRDDYYLLLRQRIAVIVMAKVMGAAEVGVVPSTAKSSPTTSEG